MFHDQESLFAAEDEELLRLCSAMCDGTIDKRRMARLEQLVEMSEEKCLLCALYLRMNGQLMRTFRPVAPFNIIGAEWHRCMDLELTEEGEINSPPEQNVDFLSPVSSDAPIEPFPHGRHSILTYFYPSTNGILSGWPLAYLILQR